MHTDCSKDQSLETTLSIKNIIAMTPKNEILHRSDLTGCLIVKNPNVTMPTVSFSISKSVRYGKYKIKLLESITV